MDISENSDSLDSTHDRINNYDPRLPHPRKLLSRNFHSSQRNPELDTHFPRKNLVWGTRRLKVSLTNQTRRTPSDDEDNGDCRNPGGGSGIPEYMNEKYIQEIAPLVRRLSVNFWERSLLIVLRNALKNRKKHSVDSPQVMESIDLKNNSAPGTKGISNRLLKEIFPFISNLMANAANKWILDNMEVLPPVTRKVIFIPKPFKRKDHEG